MAQESKISWTDATFNPWIGCTKVSAGCANCYAERDWDKRRHVAQWGPVGTRIVTGHANWETPRRWNRKAQRDGMRIKVFCASLADVFEDWSGPMFTNEGHEIEHQTSEKDWRPATMQDYRNDLFRLIDETPHLDWLLVTKRPENIRTMWPEFAVTPFDREEEALTHRKNVWLLASVENQEQADKRIPKLLQCRDLSPVLGLSCEPLLGPVDLAGFHVCRDCGQSCAKYGPISTGRGIPDEIVGRCGYCGTPDGEAPEFILGIDWVIAGGESGPDARPMHPDWARSLRDQCLAAGVPFHFKQWGEWSPLTAMIEETHQAAAKKYQDISWSSADQKWRTFSRLGETAMYRCGKDIAGRLLDGREWDEFPQIASAKSE